MEISRRLNFVRSLTAESPPKDLAHKNATCWLACCPPLFLATCNINNFIHVTHISTLNGELPARQRKRVSLTASLGPTEKEKVPKQM